MLSEGRLESAESELELNSDRQAEDVRFLSFDSDRFRQGLFKAEWCQVLQVVNYAIKHGHAKSFDSDAAGTELNSRPRD